MAEHEFKRGDRIVFVKDDEHGGVEMPKGTRGTYDEDDPINFAPSVLLDSGERVLAWRDSIAHVEDHGTGDGSASDICAEPGCNCDLERRFPAPLDPSKVKPGDTVTLRVEHPSRPALTVAGMTHALDGAGVYLGGWRVDDLPGYVTLIAPSPAPEPEPEWKPGDTVTEEVHILDATELQPGDVFVGPDLFDGYIVRRAQPAPEPEPAPGYYTVHPTANPETAWTGLVFEDGSFVGEEDGFYRSASKGEFTVSERLVVIDPADVRIRDAAMATGVSTPKVRAVLEHLGTEVPR